MLKNSQKHCFPGKQQGIIKMGINKMSKTQHGCTDVQ